MRHTAHGAANAGGDLSSETSPRFIIADSEIAPEPMEDSFHKTNSHQICVLIPHALSTHQPRTASKTVNIAAKKRRMLKRREKGITAKATAPNMNAAAARAHLPSLCKLGTNSIFIISTKLRIDW